jgi:VanZ family protein
VALAYWAPVAAYLALVLYVSSRSRLPGGLDLGPLDKLAHFGEYFVLGILLGRAVRASFPGERRGRVWALTIALGMAFAVADERVQAGIPGRVCSTTDFLADTAGLLTAWGIFLLRWPARWRNRAEE